MTRAFDHDQYDADRDDARIGVGVYSDEAPGMFGPTTSIVAGHPLTPAACPVIHVEPGPGQPNAAAPAGEPSPPPAGAAAPLHAMSRPGGRPDGS